MTETTHAQPSTVTLGRFEAPLVARTGPDPRTHTPRWAVISAGYIDGGQYGDLQIIGTRTALLDLATTITVALGPKPGDRDA